METTELKFVWTSDEAYDVYLAGEHICEMNHDDHGWSGMDSMETALKAVAMKQGWKITVLFEEDE